MLEGYSCYDRDGKTNAPMGAVEMRFPGENDAFGSMSELIKEGLEEDAILQAKQEKAVPEIVKQIQSVLPEFEGTVRERNAKKKKAAKMSDREIYNPFREAFAKQGLDNLSIKLGTHFPLSAQFVQTITNDDTDLVMETIKGGSVNRGKDSLYTAGKKAFNAKYGKRTQIDIKQLGITAFMNQDIVSESIANQMNSGSFVNSQEMLDLIPHLKEAFENSILLNVERVHTDNKHGALYGYRLYNLYKYETTRNGKPVTEIRAVVGTIVQNMNGNSDAYAFLDIENVTVGQSFNPITGVLQTSSSDTYSVAQLYNAVKGIERKKGGLNYQTADDQDKLFNYTTRNDGSAYSMRDDAKTDRELLMDTEGEELTKAERQELEKTWFAQLLSFSTRTQGARVEEHASPRRSRKRSSAA